MPKIHPLAAAMVEDSPEFGIQLAETVHEVIKGGHIALVPEWRAAVVNEVDRQEFARVTPGPHQIVMVPKSSALPGGPFWLWPLNDEAWEHMVGVAQG